MPAVYAPDARTPRPLPWQPGRYRNRTGAGITLPPSLPPILARYRCGVDTETLQTISDTSTDRDLLVLMLKQLDHLDTQLHELRQFIDEHKPALDKAMQVLDNPVSKYLAARKAAK